MNQKFVFVDRRQNDRRLDADPCRNLPLDLNHRKRRKSTDRRSADDRSMEEHSEAFMQSALQQWDPNDNTHHPS